MLKRHSFGIIFAVLNLSCSVSLSTAHGGSRSLEPTLQGRDDILFFEDFEDPSWYEHWNESKPPDSAFIVKDHPFRGDRCLRVNVERWQHYGLSMSFDFAKNGLEEPEEIYFRYYIYLGSTWGGGGGKFPGISGTYGKAGWGGRRSNGTNGWSARMAFDEKESEVYVGYYVYHADMLSQYGDNWNWGTITREQWHSIECYVKMNDLGVRNGILRGWINDELVFEKADIRFRDVPDLKVERIWFNIYYGGTDPAPRDMEVYFDNVVIARNYIGSYGWPNPNPSFINLPKPGDITMNSVNLSWTESRDPDFDKYEILLSTSPEEAWISIANVTNTYYEITNLSPGTTFYFRVRVWDKFGMHTEAETNMASVKTTVPLYFQPWFTMTVVLVVAVILALSVLLLRHKARRSKKTWKLKTRNEPIAFVVFWVGLR